MEQVTLRELLRNDLYKKWFQKNPDPVLDDLRPETQWYVYVQKKQGGKWRRASVTSYREGLRFVAGHIREYYDMSITNKRHESLPPVIRQGGMRSYLQLITPEMVNPIPDRATHKWCTYCRRPTVFAYFIHHHAIGRTKGTERRCSICGCREGFRRVMGKHGVE